MRKGGQFLDENDFNQVVASSGLSENKGVWVGSLVSRAHKTWSRSFLFKDFPERVARLNCNYKQLFLVTNDSFQLSMSPVTSTSQQEKKRDIQL